MIQNASFRRKVLYLCVIALLLFPLYMIGRPATGGTSADSETRPGGTLAQLRSAYDLSQAQLGEVDPASESMKLATLGMRGVAANILWTKANEYKKTQNWEALVATVNQMAKLQPNYISVWEFQSHNLSYNVSVEQDDFRFRYQWVKKGIEFLIQGTRFNRREPRLFWTLGWYTGQKFGRADEFKQFRRLFRDDKPFHELLKDYVDVYADGSGADGKPDNWLVSRLWYLRAYDLVDSQGAFLRGKSPHIFFSDGPKALMNYGAAIETEGIFGEHAETVWRKALQEWDVYGRRPVTTSWGTTIRLGEEESTKAEAKRLEGELDALAPGLRETIRQEKLAKLTPEQRAAFAKPADQLQSEEEYRDYVAAQMATETTNREVAARAPKEQRAKAYRLAELAQTAMQIADHINRYRTNVNYLYWRIRCEVEQKPEVVEARRHAFEGKRLMDQGELEAAEKEYNESWRLWADVVDKNPSLLQQGMADDLESDVKRYMSLLGQLGRRLSSDFKLLPLLKMLGEIPDYLRPESSSKPAKPEPPKTPDSAASSSPPAKDTSAPTPKDASAKDASPPTAKDTSAKDAPASAPKEAPAKDASPPTAKDASAKDVSPSAPKDASAKPGASPKDAADQGTPKK